MTEPGPVQPDPELLAETPLKPADAPDPDSDSTDAESSEPTEARLDKIVAERFALSRRAAMEAVVNGRVDVEGHVCQEPGRILPLEVPLHLDMNRPKARRIVDAPVQVLFEDAHLAVILKQPGVPTTPSADWESDTIVARVER